jgi:hypothetical protein
MAEADATLLGRKTYEAFASYWPQADPADEMTATMNGARKYVVSNTLSEAAWGELLGDQRRRVRVAIRAEGGHRIVDDRQCDVGPLATRAGDPAAPVPSGRAICPHKAANAAQKEPIRASDLALCRKTLPLDASDPHRMLRRCCSAVDALHHGHPTFSQGTAVPLQTPLSEKPVHDVETDEPMIRMPECCRNSGEDRESERLPQAYRVDVRLDDSVELHREVAILPCDFQYAVC